MPRLEMKTREVLLINFDFPPNEGIGGRRWAKLAKALAHSGVTVHVVKADPISGTHPSAWTHDSMHPNIRVHSIPRAYPTAFSHPQSSLQGKLLYQFYKKKIELTTPGTIYDQSIHWNKFMTPQCLSILAQHDIGAIIATGAPWNLLTYTAALKQLHPHIPILVDYRDPWLNAVNYGMPGLSKKRMAAEIAKQKFVFENCDIVTTPYPYLTEQLKAWCDENVTHQPAFETLPHFFDESDFKDYEIDREDNHEVRIIYAGDIYASSEPNWMHLTERINQLIPMLETLGKQVVIDVYTAATPPSFVAQCAFIRVHKPIGRAVFEKIGLSDICLLVLSDKKKDELTTKFYEYLRCRKPMLVVAPKGEVAKFVQVNKLGLHYDNSNEELLSLLNGDFEKNKFDSTFELDTYELSMRCEQLKKLLP
jgi:hypothetical protein